jgi:hypothetical protein
MTFTWGHIFSEFAECLHTIGIMLTSENMGRRLYMNQTTWTVVQIVALNRRYSLPSRSSVPLIEDEFCMCNFGGGSQFAIETTEQFEINTIPGLI